jgi:hypothetical protein
MFHQDLQMFMTSTLATGMFLCIFHCQDQSEKEAVKLVV